jgi:hypothetical protein
MNCTKFLLFSVLLAHSWYPPECCGDNDCHPIPCKDVHHLKGEYEIYGSYIPEEAVRESLDQNCHWCHAYVTKCLFLPQSNS